MKEPKSSFLDDAEYQGSLSPSHKYNVKYDLTMNRTITTRLFPTKDKPNAGRMKIPIDKNPAPGHYKVEDSFRSSQLTERVFLISKSKNVGVAELLANEKKFVPAVGSYNTESAYNYITKGASRGWK